MRARISRCFFRAISICYSRHWFRMKGGRWGYLDQSWWEGNWLSHLAHWEQEQPPASSQTRSRTEEEVCLFSLLAWTGPGLKVETAWFTQVHNPPAQDISSSHRFWAGEFSISSVSFPALQAQKPFLHLWGELRSLWHHSGKALTWVRTPSIWLLAGNTALLCNMATLPLSLFLCLGAGLAQSHSGGTKQAQGETILDSYWAQSHLARLQMHKMGCNDLKNQVHVFIKGYCSSELDPKLFNHFIFKNAASHPCSK